MMVCDRCGMKEGTCWHSLEDDYLTEPEVEYKAGMRSVRMVMVLVGLVMVYFLS